LGVATDGNIMDIHFNAPHRVHWIAVEAGGSTLLAPQAKARLPAIPAQARRYRRGAAEFDAKGVVLPAAVGVVPSFEAWGP
jgi:hypothetical protein